MVDALRSRRAGANFLDGGDCDGDEDGENCEDGKKFDEGERALL